MGLFDQIANIGRQGLGLAGGAVKAVGNHIANMPNGYTPPDEVGTNVDPLRSMNPAQKVIMALGEMGARVNGQAGPITELRQRALQQYQMKRQEFGQNLDALDKAKDFLDSVPIAQREERAAKLKEKLQKNLNIDPDLYDSIIASPDAKGLISQLREDPEAQAALQNPLSSLKDLGAIANSPGFRKRQQERQDQALTPVIETKLKGLLASPSLAPLLQKISADKQITVEEIKQLNEQAGDGPEGFKMSPEELSTLERVQPQIAQRIPGFKTTGEFEAKRESDAGFADWKAKEDIKHQDKLAEIDRQYAGREKLEKNKPPKAGDDPYATAANRERGKTDVKIANEMPQALNRGAELVKALKAAKEAHSKLFLSGPIAGRLTPNLSDASTELDNARRTILTKENPLKGQGNVSNFERQLAEATLPSENVRGAAAEKIYNRLIEQATKALKDDQVLYNQAQERIAAGSIGPDQIAAPPQAPEAGPAKTGGAVKMKFPDGSIKLVPPGDVERYKQWGEVVP